LARSANMFSLLGIGIGAWVDSAGACERKMSPPGLPPC
jgi:hypothetical protein